MCARFARAQPNVRSRSDSAAAAARSSDVDFYARALVLLFELPDFVIVSTYVLLLVVWAEAFLGSRRHWLSTAAYRRSWRTFYLVFNVCLYGAQLSLYLLVISEKQFGGLRLLYTTLAVVTLAAPGLHFVFWIFLSLKFSGFPHGAPRSKTTP